MPIGFDPNEVLPEIMCGFDKHLEESKRVRLGLRALSFAQVRKINSLRKLASESQDQEQENTLLNQAILIALAEWKNVSHPLNEAGLDEAFSTEQKYDLTKNLSSLTMLAELEKKALQSQQASAASASAKDALPSASTPQTPPAP